MTLFDRAMLSLKGDIEMRLDQRQTWLDRLNGAQPHRRASLDRSIALYRDLLAVIERHTEEEA